MKFLISGATLLLFLSSFPAGQTGTPGEAVPRAAESPGPAFGRGEVIVRIDLQSFLRRPELLALRTEIPILPEVWKTLDALVSLTGRPLAPGQGRLFMLQRPDDASGAAVVALLSDGAFDPQATRTAALGAGWLGPGSAETAFLEEPVRSVQGGPVGGSAAGRVLGFPGEDRVLFGPGVLVRAADSSPSVIEAAHRASDPSARGAGPAGGQEAASARIRGGETIRRTIGEMLPPEAVEMLADYMDLDELRISVAADDEVTVGAVAVSADERRAGAFADASRAVLGLSKLAAMQGDDAEALAALRSIRIEQDGNRVLIRVTLPDAFLRSRIPAPASPPVVAPAAAPGAGVNASNSLPPI